ncbi:MAG: hypothetical protein LBI88_05450 [Deltaproteobacteria bacterium]|nr:hypothetical protein [Deltaproteobacteria bacterium]
MPKKLPSCPLCGRKLSYDPNARRDFSGVLLRFRECRCGYSCLEKVSTVIEEYFPQSTSDGKL